VYSLGVVLYQLLTGGLPFDPERLSKVGYAEMQRILREEEPARPSTIAGKRTRGEASGEAGTDAPAPATDPRKLRGELDWIVLKAMSKDRTRRYETANGLAMDLRRFLRNEPVMAGPPSTVYRFRKFARRNRVVLAVTGAILVTITGALIHTTIQRARVQAARDEAEAVTDFLSSMLSAVSPDEEGRDVTVREVLDVAAEDVGSEFSHQTAVQARLREVIGNTYLELGDLDRARALLEDALASQEQRLPPGHEQLISAQGTLGELYRAQGHYDEAEEILLRAVEASGGVDHPVVHSFPLLNSLIAVYFRQNRIEEGESLCVKVIENGVPLLGEGHREVRKARGNLASLYAGQKRYEEAHEMFAALLRSSRELYGDDHPDVLRRMSNLAFVEGKLGRIGESERLYREALERGQHVLGPEHPDVLRTRNNLAALLIADGQFAEAEPFITAVVEQSRTVLPDDLGFLGNTIAWRGECLRGLGRYEEAKSLLLQGHETLLEVYGESHARTRRAAGFLATLYENTGDSTKAGEWRARAKDPE
jgi:tetratricopeptide (TPR) repeat protein